jgi:hypothetical protein
MTLRGEMREIFRVEELEKKAQITVGSGHNRMGCFFESYFVCLGEDGRSPFVWGDDHVLWMDLVETDHFKRSSFLHFLDTKQFLLFHSQLRRSSLG